jgi:hypothetical protein
MAKTKAKPTVNTSATTRDMTAAAKRAIAKLWPKTKADSFTKADILDSDDFMTEFLNFALGCIDWKALHK